MSVEDWDAALAQIGALKARVEELALLNEQHAKERAELRAEVERLRRGLLRIAIDDRTGADRTAEFRERARCLLDDGDPDVEALP